MPSKNLTATTIPRLPRPAEGKPPIDYWDKMERGFGVRVSASGRKTFNLQVQVISGGKKRDARIKIGVVGEIELSDAREKARTFKRMASEGLDPRKVKGDKERRLIKRSGETFSAIRDQFLEKYVDERCKPSTAYAYRSALKSAPDFSEWEDRALADMTRIDVRAVLDRIITRGAKTQANRTLQYLSKMMDWAEEHDFIEVSPCHGIKRPSKEIQRDRILTDNEIKAVWSAFDSDGGAFSVPFKLMLILGQREDEIIGMRRSEITTWGELLGPQVKDQQYKGITAKDPVWIIPKVRTKMDREHVVPLPSLAVEQIKLAGDNGFDPLFVSETNINRALENGQKNPRPISGISRAKARIDKASEVSDWRLHDLRRTVRSGMARLGIPNEIAKKVTNHKQGGIDAIYNRYDYLPERHRALNAWADLLENIIHGKRDADNVHHLEFGA